MTPHVTEPPTEALGLFNHLVMNIPEIVEWLKENEGVSGQFLSKAIENWEEYQKEMM